MPLGYAFELVNFSRERGASGATSGMPRPSRTGMMATSTWSTTSAASRLAQRLAPPNSQMSRPGSERSAATAAPASVPTTVTAGCSASSSVRENT